MIQSSAIFAERLCAARNLRKLSQANLAHRAGMHPSLISNFESGRRRPALDNLVRLSKALSVSADYLLGLSDLPTPPHEADQLIKIMDTLSAMDRYMVVRFAATLPIAGIA